MQHVIDWDGFIKKDFEPENRAATIGVFDGVHIGHSALLDAVKRTNLRTAVITFDKNPEEILLNHRGVRINSLRQKHKYLKSKNIDDIIVIDFSHEFSKIRGDVFIHTLIDRLNIKHLCLGRDFRCGHKLEMDIDTISELYGDIVTIETVEDVQYKNIKVSSSLIRQSIKNGDLSLAKQLLGRDYSFDFYGILPEIRENQFFFPVSRIVQVMPPAGKYGAEIYNGNGKSFFPAVVRIEDEGVFFDKKNIYDTSITEVIIKYRF